MHRLGLVAAAGLLLIAGLAPAGAAPASLEACLEQTARSLVGAAVRRAFRPAAPARYDRLLADAQGVVWRPREARRSPGVVRYAVAFDGSANCWVGGRIVGTGGSSSTAPSAFALGVGYRTRDTGIHLLEIESAVNGVWVGRQGSDVTVENVLLSEIKDTCLVANHTGDLVVDNAFFHKCARVVKLAGQSAGSTLTIRNSIIRINNRSNARGGGRLFNGRAVESEAEVYFRDNVVATRSRLDARSLSIIAPHCAGNTLIWLGGGDYPGELPGCFTVVEGKAAWRAARLAWLRQHRRSLDELAELVEPGAGACAVPEVPISIAPRRTVGTGTPASCSESALRGALAGGGMIVFACGAAPVTIPIRSELIVSRPTVLDGGGKVTLDGQDRSRIIRNDSQLTLRRIALTNGRADVVWNGSPGGGGAVNSTYGHRLFVVDSSFTANRTSVQGFGGAIFQAGGGALTVVRSRFENNEGGGGGAVYSLLAGLRVVDAAFVRNRGTSGRQGGGGLMTDGASAGSGEGRSGGEIAICGTRFADNQALATGGGAYLYAYGGDRVSVTRSTFERNAATPNDGGLAMGGGLRLGAAPALVAESAFRENRARTGGAIATDGSAATRLSHSTFQCNSSNVAGGRVLAEGNAFLPCP